MMKIFIQLSLVSFAHGMDANHLNLPRFPPFPETVAILRPKLDHPDNAGMDSLSFVVLKKTAAWKRLWRKNNHQTIICSAHKVFQNIQMIFLWHVFDGLPVQFSNRSDLCDNEEAQRRAEMLTTSDGIKQLLEESETVEASDLNKVRISSNIHRELGLPSEVQTMPLKSLWMKMMRQFVCSKLDLGCDFDARGNQESPSERASCEMISDEEIVNMLSGMMVRKWVSRERNSEIPEGEERLVPVHVFSDCAGDGSEYDYVSMAVHNLEEHLHDRDILRGDSSAPCAHGLCASASDFVVDQGVHMDAPHQRIFSPELVQEHFGIEMEDDIILWEQHHRFMERYWPNNFIKWKHEQPLPGRLAILVHCAAKLAFADENSQSPADNSFFSVQPDLFHHMRNALKASGAVVDGRKSGLCSQPQVWSVPHMFHNEAQRSFDDYCRERLKVVQVIPKSEWYPQ